MNKLDLKSFGARALNKDFNIIKNIQFRASDNTMIFIKIDSMIF